MGRRHEFDLWEAIDRTGRPRRGDGQKTNKYRKPLPEHETNTSSYERKETTTCKRLRVSPLRLSETSILGRKYRSALMTLLGRQSRRMRHANVGSHSIPG